MRRDHRPLAAEVLPLRRPAATRDGPLLVGEAPLPGRRGRLRWHWGRYLVLGVALYCGWIGQKDLRTWESLQAQERALQAQARALRDQQANLRAEIAYAQTPAYIEAQARQQFGLVGPGQVPLAPVAPASASGAAGGH